MNASTETELTIVDAHVHIYDCFDVATLLNSAYENFRFEALRHKDADKFTGILMLTETSRHNAFSQLSAHADSGETIGDEHGNPWHFFHTNETCSLLARSSGGRNLILIAGRQIVTKEHLEVLALGTRASFDDGTPIGDLIMAINEHGAIPVLPWGVGKWLGKRWKILRSLLTSIDGPSFFLGDNSGRPIFWPRPTIFRQAEKQGMRVLPGTDPLPLTMEEMRCGSFGFTLRGSISRECPEADIKHMLNDITAEICPYGRLEKPLRFVRNQLRIRFGQR